MNQVIEIIEDENLEKIENKLVKGIFIVVVFIAIFFIGDLIFLKNVNNSEYELTLGFIRIFNFIISVLAFGSCLISYNRLKKYSVFLISLMYLILSIDILLGNLDYMSFYFTKYTLSNYITVSTSTLRLFLIILAILPKNKLSTLIVNNKNNSILLIIIYTIIVGYIESIYISSYFHDSKLLFISYNLLLISIYLLCTYKLFKLAIKEKEYLFMVLGSSIFTLSIKAIYAIQGTIITSFYIKLMSVSITYISFLIVIAGGFIELYLHICKSNVLQDNLKVFYNLVENNKHSSMYISKENGKIIYANKAIKEYFFNSDNVNLSELEDIIKEKKDELDNYEDKKYLYENGTLKKILRYKNKRVIDYSAQLISIGKNDEDSDIAVSFIDISDEVNREIELEKLKVYDKEKNDFISNISHELRTPLNIFYSTVQLLDAMSVNENCDFRKKYDEYKKTLHINCKRMNRLINNIIDISKIDEGVLNLNFGNYNIVSLVEDISLSVVNYASLKSINIEFDTDNEEYIIKCDPLMIEKVILNLLSNAIKFSNEGDNIYVSIEKVDEYIVINIEDEGIGISKENHEKIFKKFIQVDKTYTRKTEGSGIGLNIVKSIVDIHKGYIKLNSELNIGSKFSVYLPNIYTEDSDIKTYDINNDNVQTELSDIYELSK